MQELTAFWRYDIFPFVRWGKIKAINEDGSVEPQNTPGFRFVPIVILPNEHADKLITQIQALEMGYKTEKDALEAKYREAIRKSAPFLS